MTDASQRFRLVDEAFRRAVAAPPEDRDAVIAEASGGDAAIEAEVHALLEADALEGELTLGEPIARAAPRPTRVGPYTLHEPLGSGGMGVVYRATRDNPRRAVALKVIRRALPSETARRRFRLEAEALARLQHPGIAALYEIGADRGSGEEQPYFAMELVEGEPITRYADRHALDARDRMALLADVCDAIDHAHTRGVVHRDLKPENVFVVADGRPKVLDLGIAKLVDTDGNAATAFTEQGQLVGTLGYMSPEQVSGDPAAVDPRCDVYALGVIGYELLAGRLPIDTANVSMYEAIQRVRNQSPEPLRLARPGIDTDIATIIEKALAKEADARYASAALLAADIRRFLADEPILARPPSTWYQIHKFARRNRTLVGSLGVVFAVLVLSLAAVTVSLRAAQRQRDVAEAEREVVESVNAFLLEDLVAQADPRQGGSSDVTLIAAINNADEMIAERLAHAPRSEAALRAALGEIYTTLNDFPRARDNMRRSLDLTADDEPGALLDRLNTLALLHMDLGENDEAQAVLEQAEQVLARRLPDDTYRELEILSNLGRLAYKREDHNGALRYYERVAEVGRRAFPDDQLTAAAIGAVALIYSQTGRPEEALPLQVEVSEIMRRLLGPDHPDTLTNMNNHAMLLGSVERWDESEAMFRRVLESRLRVMGDEHVGTNVTRAMYARMLIHAGRPAEALPLAGLAAERLDAVLGSEHRYTTVARGLITLAEERLAGGADATPP